MQHTRLGNSSLLALFIGVSVLLFFVFAPFLSLLSVAMIFAILLNRPYERLTRALGGWKSISALLIVGLMSVFVIVPLFFLGTQIYQEAHSLFTGMQGNGSQYLQSVQTFIEQLAARPFPGFTFNIDTYIGNALVIISNNLGSLVYQTLYVVFETFLMLLALFFFLKDGRGILTALSDASPLGKETTREIFDKMYQTTKSVVQGTLVNALIRWLGIWAAFALFNIPNAILWSSIGGIVGAIPGLGTPFAFIPAIAYLALAGKTIPALGLAAFGIAIVILVDNVLTSYFFGKGLPVSPLFVLFSILGGVLFFGPLGFILGPLVLSVFLSVLHVYSTIEEEA